MGWEYQRPLASVQLLRHKRRPSVEGMRRQRRGIARPRIGMVLPSQQLCHLPERYLSGLYCGQLNDQDQHTYLLCLMPHAPAALHLLRKGRQRPAWGRYIMEGSQKARDRGVSLWPCDHEDMGPCPLLLCVQCRQKDGGCWDHHLRRGHQQTTPVQQRGMRQEVAAAIMELQAAVPINLEIN